VNKDHEMRLAAAAHDVVWRVGHGTMTAANRDSIRTRAAKAISAFSEAGAAAVRVATEQANGATPSLLALTAIALEHGVAAARDVPSNHKLSA
jgi:hypothetical protein